MTIVELEPTSTGGHRNQTIAARMLPPRGWAIVPETMMPLERFPFGSIEAALVDGVMTVTGWTPGEIPEPEPDPEPQPTAQEDTDAMLVDLDYRLTLLELGV